MVAKDVGNNRTKDNFFRMKRETLSYIMLLAFLVSACGAPAIPTTDPVSLQSTSLAVAFTIVAETQAAIPPTDAPTQTPLPTNTAEPSPTVVLSPTDFLTFTPEPVATKSDPCNKALVTWEGPSASFSIVNESKPKGSIILMMSVLTTLGECGWLNIYSDSFTGPIGNYSAGAFIDGEKDFKSFGAFRITEGGWDIIVRNDTITAQGACYPNC